MMKYQVVAQPLQSRFLLDQVVSYVSKKNSTEIYFLSKENYQIVNVLSIPEETFISAICGNDIILFHFNKSGYYRILNNKQEVVFVESEIVPEYTWDTGETLNLDRKKQKYNCTDSNGKEVYEIKSMYPISIHWFKSGILSYQNNEKENNWIKCLNPNGGDEIWNLELPWHLARLETFNSFIVLEYHAYERIRTDKGYEGKIDLYHPNIVTIVLNGYTGQEIWRYPNGYIKIDKNFNSVLFGGEMFIEIELNTGQIITEVRVKPHNIAGGIPHFTDKRNIYYLTNDHSFGKINKITGEIQWEIQLLDEKGQKRMLSNWLLLGNGNLVLQTMLNHPNGDFTCIFNPEENLEYSKVKDGIRIPPPHA